jgi:proline iminopeptidase
MMAGGGDVAYPPIEPYETGMLDVGDDQSIYWEASGNPEGKAAVAIHGGPGGGGTPPGRRRWFDPDRYRLIQFDQRGCSRSTPHVSDWSVGLETNTTHHLIADIERLREHLGIDRWLVWGGSWGVTLGLAYAERYPERVTEMILFGVTTGRHEEMDWLFRGGVARFFPEQWERLRAGAPEAERDGEVVAAYARRLDDPDARVRARAAEEWCLWESATPAWPPTTGVAARFADPRYALAFARIVTDYSTYAYLCDVYVLEEHRGKGLGKWMIDFVMKHPELQGLRRFQLVTRDAHSLYTRFGFRSPDNPERQMEIFRPGLYSGVIED